MTPVPTTARDKFSEVLKFYRLKRGWSHDRVGRVCGVSAGTAEQWETGKAVPTSNQWKKLKAAVERALHSYNEHYQAAVMEHERAGEQDRSQHLQSRPTAQPHVTTNGTRLTTNFGDKLVHAIAQPPTLSPQPAEPDRANAMAGKSIHDFRPDLPPDWKTTRAINARKAFALNILRERPDINDRGPDGLQELIVKRFGVGLSGVTDLKMQVKAEIAERTPRKSQTTESVEQRAPRSLPPPVSAASPNDNLAAAVDLILSSVPNLAAFSIVVDDSGKATVDYKLRETKVVETSGTLSMQVKRG